MSHNCSCSGNCASCGGCARELSLAPQELLLLQELGQIPFLPVARKASDMIPIFLEDDRLPPEEYSLAIQCLEVKGLISLDYDRPLANFNHEAYKAYPVRGSMALTARGQSVLELLELQGIAED